MANEQKDGAAVQALGEAVYGWLSEWRDKMQPASVVKLQAILKEHGVRPEAHVSRPE